MKDKPNILIRLTDLYAVHCGASDLEHAIRQGGEAAGWRPFAPSRFVYAFFAFNGIYSINWKASVEQRSVTTWRESNGEAQYDSPDGAQGNRPHAPNETKQICRLVDFCYERLGDGAVAGFAGHLHLYMSGFKIADASEYLEGAEAGGLQPEQPRRRRPPL